MTSALRPVFLGTLALGAVATAVAQVRPIPAPDSRLAALARAEALLAQRPPPAPEQLRGLKDPFNPAEADLKDLVVDASAKPKDTGPRLLSDADILQLVAAAMRPTGIVEIGGEPFLLFGEKRLKRGDRFSSTHDGIDYVVVIDSIEPNRFSIRYNSQVLFRQIK